MEYVVRTDAGEWQLSGSRVPLQEIIRRWQSGTTAEAIAAETAGAALDEIYGAIAFYLRNRPALDKDFAAAAATSTSRPAQQLSEAQRHALNELLQTVYDALTEGGGKPSSLAIERMNELIARQRLPYESYREVINTAFAHWYRANPHKARLAVQSPFDRPRGKQHAVAEPQLTREQFHEIEELVWQILERTNGDPADDDALAVDAFCRQLSLSAAQARHVVGSIVEKWTARRGKARKKK